MLWSFFPSIDFTLRKISMAYFPHFAFFVNFVLIDSVLYLFFIVLFLALCQSDIPSKAELTKKHPFYVTDPKNLEPRRLTPNKCSFLGQEHIRNILGQKEKRVTDYRFPHIPFVRRTLHSSKGSQFKVVNYVSTGETDILALKRKSISLETSRSENSCKSRFLQVEPFKLDQNSDFVSNSNLSNICSSPEKVFGRFNYLKNKQTHLYRNVLNVKS